MKGTEIIVSANPQGKFDEGLITDTSKPGTCMELVPAVGYTNGRGSYRARSQTAGAVGPVIVLLPDSLQGLLYSAAYVANTRGFLYWPQPGDHLNMLLADVTGTGDVVAVGDLFGVDNGGLIKRDSSYNDAAFEAQEALVAATAAEWVWVRYTGRRAG